LDASDDKLPSLFEEVDEPSHSAAGDESLLFMEEDAPPASAASASAEDGDEFDFSAEEEYDAYNSDDQTRQVMREINSEVDGDKRVKLLMRAAYAMGRKEMRVEVADGWQKMAFYIAWSTCKSLNVYDQLRMMVMYEARQPFQYANTQTGQAVQVKPACCSRLLSASLSDTSAGIFHWKRDFLNNLANQREIERAIASWKVSLKAIWKRILCRS
jgi:hypothetical protein